MSRYSNYAIKNNVFGVLSNPISSLATTIQLEEGQGARFSTNMLATLENIESGKVIHREIVLVTAINGDVLTVTRKVAPCPTSDDDNSQGQVSFAFTTGDTISAYIDKEHFDKIEDGFSNTNEEIDDLHENGTDNLRTYKTTGLGVEVKPGKILVGTSYYDFDGDTLTLTDNATNYIEIDEDGNLQVNTTGRIDENAKISKVTTSGGQVTAIEDWRIGTMGGRIGGTNIHDLTEKDDLHYKDEFIIADSENIYQNKKVMAEEVGNMVKFPPAGESISKGKMIYYEGGPLVGQSTSFCALGFENPDGQKTQKLCIKRLSNGTSFSSFQIRIAKELTQIGDISVRLETMGSDGNPTGTLIHTNAYGTISSSSVTASTTNITVNLQGSVSLTKGQFICFVFSVTQTYRYSYYKIYGNGSATTLRPRFYDGSSRTTRTAKYNPFKLTSSVFSTRVTSPNLSTTIRFTEDFTKFCYESSGYCYVYSCPSKGTIQGATQLVYSYNRNAHGRWFRSDGKSGFCIYSGYLYNFTTTNARDVSNPTMGTYYNYSVSEIKNVSRDGHYIIAQQGQWIYSFYLPTAWSLTGASVVNQKQIYDIFGFYSGYDGYVAFSDDGYYAFGLGQLTSSGSTYTARVSRFTTPFTYTNWGTTGNTAVLTQTYDSTTGPAYGIGGVFMFNQGSKLYGVFSITSSGGSGNQSIFYNSNIPNIDTDQSEYLSCSGVFTGVTMLNQGNATPQNACAMHDYSAGDDVYGNTIQNKFLSGLRIGGNYYLSSNGGVSASGSQLAGKAISDNTIIIKNL